MGGAMRRHSRETENLQGIPIVNRIQGHDHLEYTVKAFVTIQKGDERTSNLLCKDKNAEVNIH